MPQPVPRHPPRPPRHTQVALLHLWTIVKNASGYNACVGTVFNCPGAYDGTKAYTTGDVVEVKVCMCARVTFAFIFTFVFTFTFTRVLVHVHVHVRVRVRVRVPTDLLTSRLLHGQGRVMRTVDGRGFYLGRRAQGETSTCVPPLDEEAEFGAVDDLLSV